MISDMLNGKRHSRASAFENSDAYPSELNELLRLVVIRSDRLERLEALNAPEIVLRNERRMLRVAVTAVIENAGNQYLGSGFSATTGVNPSDPGQDNPGKSRRQPTQPFQLSEEQTR